MLTTAAAAVDSYAHHGNINSDTFEGFSNASPDSEWPCSHRNTGNTRTTHGALKMHGKPGKERKPGRESGERVKVNVSGTIFETYMSTLQSKNGSIFRLCNIKSFYNENKEEFYFERNAKVFEEILVYLQCGILNKPDNVAYRVFIEDLQFFGFGDKAFKIYKEGFRITNLNDSNKPRNFRTYIWNIFENPDYNKLARFMTIFSTAVIFLSIVVFLTETFPSLDERQIKILTHIEAGCVTWFTIEWITRFVVSDCKRKFLTNWLNIIDLVSILPFYFFQILHHKVANSAGAFVLLRALRLARLFRIFKLYRYSKAIHLIVNTLISSFRELLLLLFFVLVITILFASAIYYFEHEENSPFRSIPHTFWFCIVTITTVGYGDIVPATAGGRFTASVLSVTGVLVIALPIPVIVNNFSRFYEKTMSNSPAFRFDFDPKKSHEVDDMVKREPIKQLETTV